jgi:hypothetical protein
VTLLSSQKKVVPLVTGRVQSLGACANGYRTIWISRDILYSGKILLMRTEFYKRSWVKPER